ncbi:hypothetical protein FH972_007082 [Carpinus fangiana]|uniref:Bowman-Birk serine protease inhibitors family domain-containing protein n=1 Tax=Carpinus fangiana TaxID=176857 RepID=A0A5N6QUJ6_9ROSI|nr:hypothetical protein FH972_007082 [Carpinus fangiana]
MGSCKAAAVVLMSVMVLLASLEVGEGIKWRLDTGCYDPCFKTCTGGRCDDGDVVLACKDVCSNQCTVVECFFCLQVGPKYDHKRGCSAMKG